jgi:hypothetical protein
MSYSKNTKSWSPFQNDIAFVVGVHKRGVADADNELEVCLPVRLPTRTLRFISPFSLKIRALILMSSFQSVNYNPVFLPSFSYETLTMEL